MRHMKTQTQTTITVNLTEEEARGLIVAVGQLRLFCAALGENAVPLEPAFNLQEVLIEALKNKK